MLMRLCILSLKIRLKKYAARVVDGGDASQEPEEQDPDEARCAECLNKVPKRTDL